jgi:hypothetical protein
MDYNGTDQLTYTISDGYGKTATGSVSIQVTAVNDVPKFTKGANQAVLAGAGPQTVTGWATNVSAGASNEGGQALNFIVTSDNTGLFTNDGQPAVSASGELSFTPAAGADGTAVVSVRLHDDGGTAFAGLDTSASQTFNIAITQGALVVEAGGSLVTGEDGAQATFTVALSAKPAGEVTIVLESTDSGEGSVSPTTLVFTAENWNIAQTVTVTGVDDSEQDGDVAYQVTLDASSSADVSYRLATAAVDLTNRDNDEQQGQSIFLPLVVR